MNTLNSPHKDYDPESPEAKACRSQAVGVQTLHSSPTNPRKTFDPAKMAELVESIKQVGILQPILVRLWPSEYAWTGDMPLCDAVDEKRLAANERAQRIASMAAEELVRCEGMATNSPDEYLIPLCQADDHMRDCVAHLCHHGLAASHETDDGYLIVQFGDFTLGAG